MYVTPAEYAFNKILEARKTEILHQLMEAMRPILQHGCDALDEYDDNRTEDQKLPASDRAYYYWSNQ